MTDAKKEVVYGWELWSPTEGTYAIVVGTGFHLYVHERDGYATKYVSRQMASLDEALEYARDYTNQLGKNNYQVLRTVTPFKASTELLVFPMSNGALATLQGYLRDVSDRIGTKQKVRRPRRKR